MIKPDYSLIGQRIARRRRKLKYTQMHTAELADISEPYLSNIERSVSIPSTEVIMRLAIALETTPDEFLVGATKREDESWRDTADNLRGLTPGQLKLVEKFIGWVKEQNL